MTGPAVRWLAMAVAAAATAATACERGGPASDDAPGTGVVELVIDGDTIDVRIDGREERVRLIGIDTPEVARPDHPGDCYGPEASNHTAGLLAQGTEVRLVRDVVARDDYGRLLAYVYRTEDGLFVNERIMADGFARPLNIEPNSAHRKLFVEAAKAAQRSSLGLWSACNGRVTG